MFHRVPVDVIHVRGEVVFIADGMFPIARLPDLAFAFATVGFQVWRQTSGEASFQKSQSVYEIEVVLGQGPEHMHMIGQNADSDGFDRMIVRHVAIRCAEMINVPNQCIRLPVMKTQREAVGSARHIETTIVRHISNIS